MTFLKIDSNLQLQKVKRHVTVLSTAHVFENVCFFIIGFQKKETKATTHCNGQAIRKL
jgi:hypothetical protein